MSSINFYIKQSNRKGESNIYLTYQDRGKKFRYLTGQKINDRVWNEKQQRVKKNSSNEDLNIFLDELAETLKKLEREQIKQNKDVDIILLKSQLLDEVGKLNKDKSLLNIFNQFIEKSRLTKKPNTVKSYVTTFNKLLAYEKYKKKQLTFDSFDISFYGEFQDFLIKEYNLLNNTIGGIFKEIKVFLNYATDHGFNKKLTFKKYKAHKEDADIIYLTEEELLKILNTDFKGKTINNVRDYFCFACFTGLRYSDIANLSKENIKNGFIVLRTEKTKDTLMIPLNTYAKQILERNNNDIDMVFNDVLSNQKTNEYLKQIGKMAEINEDVILTQYSGATKVETRQPKYNFISTHTARRTFVTLSLEKGMRPEIVMQITGHKNYSTFKKYIKLTDQVKIQEMNRIWA